MTHTLVVSSLGEYVAAVAGPKYRLGLYSVPATPWYLGQPDLKGSLVPSFYLPGTKIRPEHEREVLRDYRFSSAEFASLKGLSDLDVLVSAHMNALPTRIMEWSANALFALFIAVENLSTAENARVWVLNPWRMNMLTQNLEFVPSIDSDHFKKYVIKLDDPSAAIAPEALSPMAFRPYRINRNYNLQNVFWTVHGVSPAPLETLKFFMKTAAEFVTMIQIAKDSKKAIMKELHDLGVTRSNFYPGAASLTRTLAYRYSANYIE